MPIDLSTINNNAGVAKTFAELGKDRFSASWLNTTDTTATKKITIDVKSRVIGSYAPNGSPVRQVSFQSVIATPTTVIAPNGNAKSFLETIKTTLTVTAAEIRSVLTDTDVVDCVAYARNGATGTNILNALKGMV